MSDDLDQEYEELCYDHMDCLETDLSINLIAMNFAQEPISTLRLDENKLWKFQTKAAGATVRHSVFNIGEIYNEIIDTFNECSVDDNTVMDHETIDEVEAKLDQICRCIRRIKIILR